jgi:hypothetical protein
MQDYKFQFYLMPMMYSFFYLLFSEESGYVRTMNNEIQSFTESIQKRLPPSYFRSVCDKFALAFIYGYHEALVRQKRISESGTQQLLLDVYNLKTFLLKLSVDAKTVTKEFSRIEIFLKLVGTRSELLSDMFKASWPNGTTTDITTIMNLKGMKRTEQQSILDNLGFSAPSATVGSEVSGKIQLLNERGMDVAARVNSDLTQMRQKVDEFRMTLTSR